MQRNDFDNVFDEVRRYINQNLKTRKVQSMFFGDWDSPYIGDGFDFGELREWSPGDNPQRLHLASSAKAGKPIAVKRMEQKEQRIAVILDATPSMLLRDKPLIAAGACAVLLLSAMDQRIPCGLFVAGSKNTAEIMPDIGNSHQHRIKDTISKALFDDMEGTRAIVRKRSSAIALRSWSNVLPDDSFVFILSDFLDENSFSAMSALDEKRHGYRVIPAVVQDDLEYTFPKKLPIAGINLKTLDAESGEVGVTHVSRSSARARAVEHETRFEGLTKEFEGRHIPFAHLENADIPKIHSGLQKAIDELHARRA